MGPARRRSSCACSPYWPGGRGTRTTRRSSSFSNPRCRTGPRPFCGAGKTPPAYPRRPQGGSNPGAPTCLRYPATRPTCSSTGSVKNRRSPRCTSSRRPWSGPAGGTPKGPGSPRRWGPSLRDLQPRGPEARLRPAPPRPRRPGGSAGGSDPGQGQLVGIRCPGRPWRKPSPQGTKDLPVIGACTELPSLTRPRGLEPRDGLQSRILAEACLGKDLLPVLSGRSFAGRFFPPLERRATLPVSGRESRWDNDLLKADPVVVLFNGRLLPRELENLGFAAGPGPGGCSCGRWWNRFSSSRPRAGPSRPRRRRTRLQAARSSTLLGGREGPRG